jgi:inosine/xanthosine triphosphatase
MDRVIVAVGSTRRPKLNAVWEALTVLGPTLDPNVQFAVEGMDVPSGVGHTPLSRGELMAGARGRAEAVRALARERGAAAKDWRYFVGLEGGLDVVADPAFDASGRGFIPAEAAGNTAGLQPLGKAGPRRLVFLESWACVMDAAGRAGWGQSGAILLPDALARRVVDEGEELAAAIDDFAGASGIRDAQGAWGVLSRNLITRQDAFRTAVVNAFAPFFNHPLYN